MKRIHNISITVYEREVAYKYVNTILHDYADELLLRVGYPVKDRDIAIIFLVAEMTTDELGALTGKLGQIKSVKVKSTTLKTE